MLQESPNTTYAIDIRTVLPRLHLVCLFVFFFVPSLPPGPCPPLGAAHTTHTTISPPSRPPWQMNNTPKGVWLLLIHQKLPKTPNTAPTRGRPRRLVEGGNGPAATHHFCSMILFDGVARPLPPSTHTTPTPTPRTPPPHPQVAAPGSPIPGPRLPLPAPISSASSSPPPPSQKNEQQSKRGGGRPPPHRVPAPRQQRPHRLPPFCRVRRQPLGPGHQARK